MNFFTSILRRFADERLVDAMVTTMIELDRERERNHILCQRVLELRRLDEPPVDDHDTKPIERVDLETEKPTMIGES